MDIRDVIKGLALADVDVFAETRRRLRSEYINVLSTIVGVKEWSQSDDMFLDAMDIKVIQLFERAGRYNPSKPRDTHSSEPTAEELASTKGTVTEVAIAAANGTAKEAGTGAVAAALGGDTRARELQQRPREEQTAADRLRDRT